ncbi:rifin PIR protein, putative [Plasmodium reichenowi]|uniref:Rifin PIR protein, putative n=1 Tax=Plasmodium reichenowi TaxID=5854 RepID=A0A2P9DST6_PLARE|nr:rifin PIR protein, putative [Plasmodium reichenowi]
MKVHYFNILLFASPLNILVYNQRNHYMKPHTYTNRSLCECELYSPPNYDNDPEMKRVMQQFEDRTSQRFHEYDERIKTTRQKCKQQCDKEIQKIILKDKLEKQMAEQLTTLETKIDTNDIPTCVCEKTIADKVEKGCLRCGGVLGGGVAPGWGLVSGLGYAAWIPYFATTVAKAATDAGIEAGVKVGLAKVTEILGQLIKPDGYVVPTINRAKLITLGKFTDGVTFSDIFKAIDSNARGLYDTDLYEFFSFRVQGIVKSAPTLRSFTEQSTAVSSAFNEAKEGILAEGASKTSSLTTGITASVVTIVVIVLIMVIIYLILRYRRKKKMKKKLQYIKLLE